MPSLWCRTAGGCSASCTICRGSPVRLVTVKCGSSHTVCIEPHAVLSDGFIVSSTICYCLPAVHQHESTSGKSVHRGVSPR